jgi:outer membrane protein OmpA-like peptidoglycan-associated protein
MDPGSGGFFEDLYVSYKNRGNWGPAQNLGQPINSEGHDATAGLSNDGSTLYIYQDNKSDAGDLYESTLKGTNWQKPEHLNKYINTKFHESTISESFDDKMIYFVSDKENGLGDRDIYSCKKDSRGNWTGTTNMGSVINTKYAEEGVFLHPDGVTMYFSSQGHGTMGGYDIFKSTLVDGKWSEPVNLGWPINGPDDDVFFVVSGNGRRGYYSSAREGGYGDKDIYAITFLGEEKPFLLSNEDNLIASITAPVKTIQPAPPVEIKTPSLTILKGTITDAITQEPLEATIELIDNTKNELVATFKSNSATGKYLVTLPDGRNYGIAVTRDPYLFHSENFDIPPTNGYQEVIKDVQLKKVVVGTKIILKNIFFDFDKSTLRPESVSELERLIKFLNDEPTVKIEIGGHTDWKGSDEYNIKLSQSRCESVVKYLIDHGIAKERLTAHGYGEKVPIDTNETDDGRQMNRRTEFEILSK